MYGLVLIFVHTVVKPYDGRNASRVQGFAAHPHDIELTRGHLGAVPGAIAAQLQGTHALGLCYKPQGACRRHDQPQGVSAHDPSPLTTLVLAQGCAIQRGMI
jgi:hypothetical protein